MERRGSAPSESAHLDGTRAIPIHFEANRGQTDGRVEFLARGRGYVAFLSGSGAVFSAPHRRGGSAIRMTVAGAGVGSPAKLTPCDPLPGRSHYFLGNDPAKWVRHVPHYAGLVARGVEPGIDLRWRTVEGRALRYDLEVAAGSDPRRVVVRFEGAETVRVADDGALVVVTTAGEFRHGQPVAFQEVDGQRRPVEARWERREGTAFGFALGAYDRAAPLVIDPTVTYSSYLGGLGADTSSDVAADAAGRSYVTTDTLSVDFPTTLGAFQENHGGGSNDAAVTKLDPVTGLVFSTFIGGNSDDDCRAIVLDATASAYVTGATRSTNFPVQNEVQGTNAGGLDAWVARLSPDGASLVFSTYLGGSSFEVGQDVALGPNGETAIVGSSGSDDFPTTPNAPQTAYGGAASDAILAVLDSVGQSLICATYLGGSSTERGHGIVFAGASPVVAGFTDSSDFPVVNAVQATFGGIRDAFIAKANAACTAWDFATYHGGSGNDVAVPLAVDGTGRIYVGGNTDSSDFPIVNAAQPVYGGLTDAFISRFDAAGTSWEYSTYVGGSAVDSVSRLVVEPAGGVHMAGGTRSTNFPVSVDAVQANPAGLEDGFYLQLAADGASFAYGTFFGGSLNEGFGGLDVDASWTAHLCGRTGSTDLPIVGDAIQTSKNALDDGFLVRMTVDEIGAGGPDVGDGSLYLSRAAFKINRAQHAKEKERDAFVVKGCVNPAGASANPSGATISLSVNGNEVVAPIALDSKGRGKSASGVEPAVRVQFKPSNGQFFAQVKKTDLRTAIQVADATANTTEVLTVTVTVANAGLVTDTATGDLEFPTRSREGKSARGAYSFRKGVSRTAVFKATRTQVAQAGDGGHRVSLRAAIAPGGGGPLTPTGDVTLTIGSATPIVVPAASFRTTGKPGAETYSYSRSLGEVAGLKKLAISNRSRSLTVVTDELAATGVPGSGGATTYALDIEIEIDSVRYGTTVEILRPSATTGRWRR